MMLKLTLCVELEFYTEEELRPKAPRLDRAHIEDLQRRYAE